MRARRTAVPGPARLVAPLLAAVALGVAGCSTSSEASSSPTTTEAAAQASTSTTAATPSTAGTTSGGGIGERAERPAAVEEIVVIGDSITVGATTPLAEQLDDAGWDRVTIVAQEGKRIDADPGGNPSGAQVATMVAADATGDPEQRLWVVALGTNDIGNTTDVDAIVAIVDEVLDSIPDDAPLIWIDTWIDHRAEGSELMNDAIAAALDERGNAVVGRWSDVAVEPGVLSGDGVHPSDRGSVAFARLVARTVADFTST